MEARKTIKVECLESKKAWELFMEKVGEETIKSHPDIEELAIEVVKQCGGLPLALITIGRAMTNKKTAEEWRYVIEMLKRSASQKFENEVYPLLKVSYDCLPATIRSCFLYCCLFPEDCNISKRKLIEYWFCEGFLNEFERISEARLQGYNIIHFLLNACLLERTEEEDCVKMHDVIRDMAIWIACELEATGEKFLVKAGVRLAKAPEVGSWKGTRRISLMSNQLTDLGGTPNCPSLNTLLLKQNVLSAIRDGFFQHMPNIRVLDLSHNLNLNEVPDGVEQLISLECLNLSYTSIRELPRKLKSLRNLKILDMNDMIDLRRIPRNVISSFSKLQIFRLIPLSYSLYPEDEEDNVLKGGNEILIEELECLQHLSMLSIQIKSCVALERFLGRLQGRTEELWLRKFTESKVFNVSSLKNMEHLETLNFSCCRSMEEIQIIPMKTCCFHAPSVVIVEGCDKLRDITWLILAPNLRSLGVLRCAKVEEIMEEEKLSAVADVVRNPNPTPFLKLQILSLVRLPELKSINWNSLPFPCLTTINMMRCDNLKKLPLNSDSAKGNKISIYGPMSWWENLEWEDEATRNAFLPHFKLRG